MRGVEKAEALLGRAALEPGPAPARDLSFDKGVDLRLGQRTERVRLHRPVQLQSQAPDRNTPAKAVQHVPKPSPSLANLNRSSATPQALAANSPRGKR